jgi:urease beta subunit
MRQGRPVWGARLGAGLLAGAVLGFGVLSAVPGSGQAAEVSQRGQRPSLSIQDVAVQEGDSGTTVAVFKVSLSSSTRKTVKVRYAGIDGTGTSPSDYRPATGTLEIKSGRTSGQVRVVVNGDVTPESDEQFLVRLSAPVNASIADQTATGTITDDDAPTISIGNATLTEGNSGTVNAVFAVTLSAVSASTVTVDYSTFDGSAAEPGDYGAAAGTLTFTPGQTAKQIVVAVSGDTMIETNETFTVNLANPANATVAGTGIATGTITNDDALPALTIGNAAVTEGNSGTANAVFAVTLSAVSASTVTVDYSTFDGSAAAPGDYGAAAGTLTFTPGQTAKQIIVPAHGDTTIETNETFTVALANPANATISGTGVGTGTITNDDAVPSLSINNVSHAEGNSDTTSLTFTVTLSAASGLSVSVDFATADVSAVAPGDYQSQTGSLTFNPGQTTKTITVLVNADVAIEALETFTVALSGPVNASLATGTGTGTILNDD